MKIQKFNEYLSNLYHEIDWKMAGTTPIEREIFWNVEIEILKKSLSHYRYSILHIDDDRPLQMGVIMFIDESPEISNGRLQRHITIQKLKDGWFIISQDLEWYKCDQIDGLVKCIKDNFSESKIPKLKRGDEVIIRNNMDHLENTPQFRRNDNSGMDKYFGKKAKITNYIYRKKDGNFNYWIDIDDGDYWWLEECFE